MLEFGENFFSQMGCSRLSQRWNGVILQLRERARHPLFVALSMVTLFFSIYVYTKKNKKSAASGASTDEEDSNVEVPIQGGVFGSTKNLERDERENVWHNDVFELTNWDMPVSSLSLAGVEPERFRDIIANNLVNVTVEQGKHRRHLCGYFVVGNKLVVPKHLFEGFKTPYCLTLRCSAKTFGVRSDIVITVSDDDIVSSGDVAMFEVACIPPRRDLLRFWAEQNMEGNHNAVLIMRKVDGSITFSRMTRTYLMRDVSIAQLDLVSDLYMGTVEDSTKAGDCGALLVLLTPKGPLIVGQHLLGRDYTAGSHAVTRKVLENLMEQCQKKSLIAHDVQGAPAPDLAPKTLGALHFKSNFRFIEEGNANVYGTFNGFRPRPRTKVQPTPESEFFLGYFEVEQKFAPPVMAGWEPWYNNAKEMVRQNFQYDRSVLRLCVEEFTRDIVEGLPEGSLSELCVLSNKEAVNGIPGVQFIDRLKVSTSMGFPWNTTKKKYLKDDICDVYPNGVTFTDEVWQRVDKIEEHYRTSMRHVPIFSAHLKDEPIGVAKVEAKKTRAFTGAPVDWSIVVRKYLLPAVRLIQKNKFVFECGAGTVCQAIEWTNLREFLTQFGEDRIVAGDYGKYDKRMTADFVLAAYRIVYNLYKQAGASEDVLRVIQGIAIDTAFPTVNWNGDCVEFFGTNPSGHPLTVIINSLANALYMRYVYCVNNPDKEVRSFKSNVALMTYGDDNAMGVNRDCDWFNHTIIQLTLQEIGVEYTMPDKLSESVPFTHFDECSFLKRTWRYEEGLQAYACVLDETSIHKSLTIWCPSGTLCKEEQMVRVITSANNEYFFYGREVFEKHRRVFQQVLNKPEYRIYVEDSTLPTWDQLVERFHRASRDFPVLHFGNGRADLAVSTVYSN